MPKAISARRRTRLRATAAIEDLVSATTPPTRGCSHAADGPSNGRTLGRRPRVLVVRRDAVALEVHVPAGHTAPGRNLLLLRLLRHHGLRGQEQRPDRRRVLQGRARTLG